MAKAVARMVTATTTVPILTSAACTARRAAEGADSWMVAKAFARVVPATTKVLVRTDAGAGAMNGGLAAGGGAGGPGGAVGGTGGGTGARRMTRSKHGLGGPAMALSPRRKRSRCAPAAVGRVLASQRG